MAEAQERHVIKKRGGRTSALAPRPLTTFVLAALAQCAAANPTGHQVAAGSATVQAAGKNLTVTNAPGTILNWQSFSIAPGELTKFVQQSSASAVLNRVIAANPSSIMGALTSNGRVFLVNPHGIVIGAGALIDTAGFVASTLTIADKDFLAGKLKFEGGGAGVLRNEGTIQAARDIFLVGPQIENAGIIRSSAGDVVLAAGKSITITSPDAHGVQFGIQAPEDSVVNLGTIQAANAVGLFAGTLKHSGEIKVASASLDSAGHVVLSAQKDTILDGNATISVYNSAGKGGSVQVLGERVGLFDRASISAQGAAGGGEILVGGDYRGLNPDVRNAFVTWLAPDARLDASAISSGDGGRIIVWADDTARAHGHISVRGGIDSGNGGFVETSGKRYLEATRAPDISAPAGTAGKWLLDPTTTTVDNNPTMNNTGTNPFRPEDENSTSTLNFGTLQTAVNAGGIVEVNTTAVTPGGGAGGDGDIIFNVAASFSPTTAAATLILKAARHVQLNNGITKGGTQNLTIDFQPNQDGGPGAATVFQGVTILGGSAGTLKLDSTTGGRVILRGGTLQSHDFAAATGFFDVAQGLTIDGTVNILPGATVQIQNGVAPNAPQTGNVISGTANAILNVQGTLAEESGLIGVGFTVAGGTPQFNVDENGTFVKRVNAGTVDIAWRVNNMGEVRVESGMLRFNGTGAVTNLSTGTLHASNAGLELVGPAGSLHNLSDGAVLMATGTGTFSITNAANLALTGNENGTKIANGTTITLPNSITGGTGSGRLVNEGTLNVIERTINGIVVNGGDFDGTLNFSGTSIANQVRGLTNVRGTINNTATPALVTNNGDLNWQGGTFTGGGTFNTGTGGFNVSATAANLNNAVINNAGGATAIENGGNLVVAAGGSLTAGTTTINAGGTLRKTGGTLTPGIFNNNGTFTLDAGAGTQEFINGGTSSGIFNAENGTTIEFETAGTHTLTAGSQLNGPGNFLVDTSVTLDLTGTTSPTAFGSFNNLGLVRLNGASLTGPVGNQGTLHAMTGTNQWNGHITTQPGSAIVIDSTLSTGTGNFIWQFDSDLTGTGTFTIGGIFSMASGSPHVVNGPTINANGSTSLPAGQSLQLMDGTINFGGTGGIYSGTLTVDAGNFAGFVAGNHTLNGATLSGAGTISNNGATLNLTSNPTTASVATFHHAAGTLNLGTQTFTKDGGLFDFTNGTITGTGGTFQAGNNAIFRSTPGTADTPMLTGANIFNLLALHAQSGTLALAGTNTVNVDGTVTIDDGATIRVDGGTFAPTAAVNNDGTFTLNSGDVDLPGGGFHSGIFTAATGTQLSFDGMTHTLNGAQLNGPGNIRLTGGNLLLQAATTSTRNGGPFAWSGSVIDGTGTLTLTNSALQVFGPGFSVLNGATINAEQMSIVSGTLQLQNGALNTSGTVAINGPGTIEVSSGTFNPTGVVDNAGLLTLISSDVALPANGTHTGNFNVDAASTLRFTGGTHTFSNAAALNGAGTYEIVNPATELHFNGATFGATGPLNNGGIFNLNGADVSLQNGGTHTGTFDVDAGSTLSFAGSQHTLNNAQLNGPGMIGLSTGLLHIAMGSTAARDGGPFGWSGDATIDGAGTFNLTNGAILQVSGTPMKTLDGATINAGQTSIVSGTLRLLTGALNTTGTFAISPPGTLQIDGGTFMPSAAFDVSGIFNVNNGTVTLAGGGTHQGTFNVANMATLDFSGGTHTLNGAQLNGAGTVVQSGGILDVTGSAAANGALFSLVSGQFDIDAGQTFTKNGGNLAWHGGSFTGPGTLTGTGGATFTFPGTGSRFFDGPTANFDALSLAGGSLTIQSGAVTVAGATSVGTGTSLVVLGGTLDTQGAFDVDGTLRNNATVNNAMPIDITANGTVAGTGTFNGDIVNTAGTLTPGASPGTMTINGDYTQMSNGVLAIDIEGTQQGVSYDLLQITGTANLAGSLHIRIGESFIPAASDTFTFMTYANRQGDFTNFFYPVGFPFTPQAGATTYGVIPGASTPSASTMSNNIATNDVVALQEEEQTSGEVAERLEEDEEKKQKGAVCS